MGFTSIDDFISEVTAGKFWRQDFIKLYAGGTAVAGNWYDLTQGNGNPAQYLHGNLVLNADFVTSQQPWQIGSSNWAYTPATHLMTRTANADLSTLYQTIKVQRGVPYYVVFTLTRSAGSITVSIGGTAGTARSTAATFREVVVCGSTDKNITFTPDASFAGTVDLVSVQPVFGGFVPYNDLTEGALWHGGDVSPDTKHLVNYGAWTNAATGVASVLSLVDVLGVYPRVRTDSAAVQALYGADAYTGNILNDCQGDWNEQTPANTAHSLVLKSTEGVTGASSNLYCVKLTISNDTFATGIVGSKVVVVGSGVAAGTVANYVYSKYVYAWVRSTINLDAGDISFCTDETANLASSQDVVLPALTANTWTRVRLDVSAIALTDKDTIISLGMKVVNDKNQAFSVYWDDVRWCPTDGVLYNGTFTGAATGWTLNTGWAYNSNNVRHTAGNILTMEQASLPVYAKVPYRVTLTMLNRTAGSVTVSLGGGTASTAISTNADNEVIITCGSTNQTLAITPTTDFDGDLDDIICAPLIPRADEAESYFGGGVRMYYVLDNALGNGANASTTVIKYTNQAGTKDRAIGATINNTASDVVAHLPHSGVGAGKYGPFIPLQAGDYGIRQADSLQFSAAQATAEGGVDVVVCKPIASIPLTTAFVAAERDLMNQLPSLPKIRDGACLMFLHHSGAVTASGVGFMGYCDFAWG
jgi:hypothetical protein